MKMSFSGDKQRIAMSSHAVFLKSLPLSQAAEIQFVFMAKAISPCC
jgi:hypothetical protein